MKDSSANAGRNHLIDAYRGLTMISMILYHSCYDYFVALKHSYDFITTRGAYLWQQSICISFILVSGMVWQAGKKHALKRGLILIALGCGITLVTVLFMPSESIYYGILTFMGIATLFMIVYDKAAGCFRTADVSGNNEKTGSNKCRRLPAGLVHIIICLILFALTKHLPNGYIGTRFHPLMKFPESLYRYPHLAVLGLPSAGFSSADYFPVIPWIFMYIIGYHLGNLLFDNETFKRLGSHRIPFLSWLGTKSLPVYIIHQPVCYGIIWLICR